MQMALSTFLGRRHELEELRALLTGRRLLTLVGTGGVGKTRLALELARVVAHEFPAGSWMVDLARTESPELVEAAIAEAVMATEGRDTGPLRRAADRLATGRQIVVLDNCEHVLPTAAAVCRYLLTECPELTVLATSRVPLGVEGEQVWLSPGLGLPVAGTTDLEAIAVTDSVRLFCDRARSVVSSFQLSETNAPDIATICTRLEGLPLAVELAAGWVRVLSVRDIARRLDDLGLLDRGGADRQPGHRTMRAALDRSDQLLTAAQRTAFHRLSVFVGGFPVAGAEAVLTELSLASSALELVASLVDCSLLTVDTTADETRYRLLEPVRQYAAQKLGSRPKEEHETRVRHLRWLADTAEAADEHILGGPDLPWLHRLDAELHNIRAALAWGFENAADDARRLAAGMVTFCVVRGLFAEGLSWARRAMTTRASPTARCLYMAGLLSYHLDDVVAADAYLGRARCALDSGHPAELAMVAFAESLVAGENHRDYDTMRTRAEEALALARSVGDEAREMYALEALAAQARWVGDARAATDLLRTRIAIARRLSNQWTVGQSLSQIADLAIETGDVTTGREAVRDGVNSTLALHRDGQDSTWLAYLLESAAIVAIQRGDAAAGLRLMGATTSIFSRLGYVLTTAEDARRQEWMQAARGLVGDAAADAAVSAGLALGVQAALHAATASVADHPVEPGDLSGFRPDQSSGEVPTFNGALPGGGAPPANAFVREGDYWSLTYGGEVVRLKDSKGLRDIARLLAAPGVDMAAVDLAGAATAGVGRSARVIAELGLNVEGDAGPVLDEEARRQYRSRLLDLEEDEADAREANDPVRLSHAREERDYLIAELRASVGLGGHGRRSLDPAERARKTVTWRIRDAMTRIEGAHPALGRHLRRSLHTGTFCRYDREEAAGGHF